MRNWTPEARKRQSEIARRDRPWTKSTGPRTGAGKERSRWNALKHGYEAAPARAKRDALCQALRAQAAYVRAINIFIKLKKSGTLRSEKENELLCAMDRQGDVVLYDLLRAMRGLGLLPTVRRPELSYQNNILQKNRTVGPPRVRCVLGGTIPEKMTNGPDKNLLRIDMTKRGAL